MPRPRSRPVSVCHDATCTRCQLRSVAWRGVVLSSNTDNTNNNTNIMPGAESGLLSIPRACTSSTTACERGEARQLDHRLPHHLTSSRSSPPTDTRSVRPSHKWRSMEHGLHSVVYWGLVRLSAPSPSAMLPSRLANLLYGNRASAGRRVCPRQPGLDNAEANTSVEPRGLESQATNSAHVYRPGFVTK